MANAATTGGYSEGFGQTQRAERWWTGPLLTVVGLLGFMVYSTWAAFQGDHYFVGPYLSPFYSPVVWTDTLAPGHAPLEHTLFGAWPGWWPSWIPSSPAFLILVFPGLFRFTCYYYRKAYYRSFMATPAGCAVNARKQKRYDGETRLMLFQNIHRYALYFAIIFVFILYYDAFAALFYHGEFGIGVGTVVLLLNATLLACFTFGCNSWRHLVGGRLNCFSCGTACGVQHKIWKRVSILNGRHMEFAWISLFWVGFSDLYVRLVSMGVLHDFNTWGF